uniref:Uncharacterized protein n=1 Tax=Timema shepardi TaxID=629360 RepID=A0A7R9B5U7_TIMSH|nr:unnamed protein product [Timema shepardi]
MPKERYKKPVISVCCWHVHCEECWLHTLSSKLLEELEDDPDMTSISADATNEIPSAGPSSNPDPPPVPAKRQKQLTLREFSAHIESEGVERVVATGGPECEGTNNTNISLWDSFDTKVAQLKTTSTPGAKKLCPQCNMITSPSDLRRIYM